MPLHPAIRTVVLKRFRSIPSGHVQLDNPIFLVGHNGSGKSNFADAFAFLAEAMVSPLQAVFDKRGGIATVRNRTSGQGYPPNLGLGVVFGSLNGGIAEGRYSFEIKALPNYGFEIVREQCVVRSQEGPSSWFDRAKDKVVSNVDWLSRVRGVEWLQPASLALPVIGGLADFGPVLRTLTSMRVYSIEPAKLREMQDPDLVASLRPDGGNATSVLQEIKRAAPRDLERIEEILATIVPSTKKVRTAKHGKKLALEFTQEWGAKKKLNFEAFSMSDGTLRTLGLLLAVYQRPTPSLIVIEEPEANIHPGALGAILDVLRHAATRSQLLITTQSPEVLDAKWIKDNHLRIVSWEEGATRISEISEGSRKAIQEHLMGAGELLRSNALEPAPLFRDLWQPTLFEEMA